MIPTADECSSLTSVLIDAHVFALSTTSRCLFIKHTKLVYTHHGIIRHAPHSGALFSQALLASSQSPLPQKTWLKSNLLQEACQISWFASLANPSALKF